MAELFDSSEIMVISISGGEPLLHPDVSEFPYIIRNIFPKVEIRLVTNGIMLLDQPSSFWDSCRKNKVKINHTKYPIRLDFEKIKQVMNDKRIEYQYMGDSGDVTKTMCRFPLLPNTMSEEMTFVMNSTIHFIQCYARIGQANNCIVLKNGKLSTCARIQTIHLLNKCFGVNYPISKYDTIDIHEAKSRDEIYNFLASPTPFCRFCNTENITFGHKYRSSECSMAEWIDLNI
jgi:hypothetical protein